MKMKMEMEKGKRNEGRIKVTAQGLPKAGRVGAWGRRKNRREQAFQLGRDRFASSSDFGSLCVAARVLEGWWLLETHQQMRDIKIDNLNLPTTTESGTA